MKTVLLIDGGYLRACAKVVGKTFDNPFIEKFSRNCTEQPEYLLRVLYYDSPRFRGKVQAPVSGSHVSFQASEQWLDDLAKLERFAVRRGTIGFRGWKPVKIPISGTPLTDADFAPVFEQKGVDMRIGLDIASYANAKAADRIVMVSGDTDMIPAMKHARKAGLEVVIVQLPPPVKPLHGNLQAHADLVRQAPWP
jgi:hypothetical protein